MFYKPHHGVPIPQDLLSRLLDKQWILKRADHVHKNQVNVVAKLSEPIPDAPEIYVIKYFGWRNTISQILSPVMRSRAKKSWDAAHWLLEHGVQTPKPIAVHTERKFGLIGENFYLCESLDDFRSARRILNDPNVAESDKDKLLKIMAEMVRTIHWHNFVHGDLTIANFIVVDFAPDQVYLIDLNRGVHFIYLTAKRRIRDIAKMDLCDCSMSMKHEHCRREKFLQYYSDNYDRDLKLLQTALKKKKQRKSLKRKLRGQ